MTAPAANPWLRTAVWLLVGLHGAKLVLFTLGGPAPLYRDALFYWQLANQAAAGDWLLLESAGATRPPGYPWFLALHRILFGPLGTTAAAATQQLAAALSGGLAAWIVWRATGSATGVVLALLLSLGSVSRSLIAQYLWSETLLTLLLTATLALYLEWSRALRRDAERRRSDWLAALVGLGLAACALTRPVAQFLVVPIAAAAFLELRAVARERGERLPGKVATRPLLALGLAFALLLAPWLLRNQALFGELFLVKFTGRTSWLSCFDPQAANLPFVDTPETRRVLEIVDGPGLDPRDLWDVYARLTAAGYSEIEADTLMAAATRATVAAQPGAFAIATARQFLGFWVEPYPVPRWRRNDPLIDQEGTDLDQRPWRPAWVLPYYQGLLDAIGGPRLSHFAAAALVSGASLAALLAQPAYRGLGIALGLTLLYFASVTAVASYPLYRFRSILEPTLIATVSIAAASGVQRLRALRASRRETG